MEPMAEQELAEICTRIDNAKAFLIVTATDDGMHSDVRGGGLTGDHFAQMIAAGAEAVASGEKFAAADLLKFATIYVS
jgi:hypothetical protein